MNRGILFVMSGPSGTGKGTICREISDRGKTDIFLSVSSTSREKRAGETDGVTYNYTTREAFRKMIADGEMLEYAEYNGNYYGTPRAAVETELQKGRNVMLEIEPQGAMKVKALFPDAVLLFILPPSMAELKRRLVGRGREGEEQIAKRLETARWEIEQSPQYTAVFVNDVLEECVIRVETLIKDEIAKRAFIDGLLKEKY